PAEMLGVNKGQIKPGFDADMLIVDSDINIKTVIINGEVFK
ncbi:MAG TPA: N-acetylglucosamine-6-phosphate deacetylase, partial [Ruminococcaceae bacterium]|nr:N-acetylglucosamine-6-phosphate deacetylase [Oscillospiraceae bacterium]